MAHSSALQRKLFMHPAHQTVGMSGGVVAPGPYCRSDGFSAEALAVTPLRVALVAFRLDADARAALALLEQAIARGRDIQCRRVEFDAADAGSESLPDADCAVLFRRGLHIARRWADLDAAARESVPARNAPPLQRGGTFGNTREFSGMEDRGCPGGSMAPNPRRG